MQMNFVVAIHAVTCKLICSVALLQHAVRFAVAKIVVLDGERGVVICWDGLTVKTLCDR